jgi:hypothetical protein
VWPLSRPIAPNSLDFQKHEISVSNSDEESSVGSDANEREPHPVLAKLLGLGITMHGKGRGEHVSILYRLPNSCIVYGSHSNLRVRNR